jgi:hypothetical protein
MAATSLTASFEAARARVPILVVVGRRLALVDDAFTALCVAIIIVVVVIVVVIRVVEYGARTTPTPPLYPLRRRCRVVTPPVHRIAHRIASVEVFIHDANAERDGRGDASIDRSSIGARRRRRRRRRRSIHLVRKRQGFDVALRGCRGEQRAP